MIDDKGKAKVNVSAITAWKNENTETTDPTEPDNHGQAPKSDVDSGKMDITVPDDSDGSPRNISYPFKNEYNVSGYIVTKQVKGDLADLDKEFRFLFNVFDNPPTLFYADTMNRTAKTGITGSDETFPYQIYNMGKDEKVGGSDDSAAGSPGTIKSGDEFSLKHNQYIQIRGMVSYELVTVTELDSSDYKTTITVRHGNGDVPSTVVANKVTSDKTTGRQPIYTGDDAVNRADFVNEKDSVTPTGVILNVLPYGMLAAAAGFGILTVFKKRRVREQ